MKMQFTLILLSLTLLQAEAGDTSRRGVADQDLVAIKSAAAAFKPEGATTSRVERLRGKDIAYVRYSVRKGDHDIVMAVVTLKQTSTGWEVESCAR